MTSKIQDRECRYCTGVHEIKMSMRPNRKMSKSKTREVVVKIAMNGPFGPPAEALGRHLSSRPNTVVKIYRHPLMLPEESISEIHTYRLAKASDTRRYRRWNLPPATYAIDFFDLFTGPSDVWIGLNPAATLRGILLRRLGLTKTVVHWSIDYSPQRFSNHLIEELYQWCDQFAARRCDIRIELTSEAAVARESRHNKPFQTLQPARIVPLGLWIDDHELKEPSKDGVLRLGFVGHLVRRMGVDIAIRALHVATQHGAAIEMSIIGVGPEQRALMDLVEELDLVERVTFHGFIPTEAEVNRTLAECDIAIAPYREDSESITNFADPGKIKNYLAAGLPIVTTAVAPISQSLETCGAALVVEGNTKELAEAFELLASHPRTVQAMSRAASQTATKYSWPVVLNELTQELLDMAPGNE